MDILIFIVAGGIMLFFMFGFALGVGSLFSTALKALYNLAEGSSSSSCSYTIPELSEEDSTPTQKPEGFLAASQRMSALQEKRRAEMKAAERARWARKTPAEQAETIRLRKKMIYNMLGHEHPPLPHADRLAKAEAIYQERLQNGYYG